MGGACRSGSRLCRRTSDCQPLPVWRLPHCSWGHPHCCPLCCQVPAGANQAEDSMWRMGNPRNLANDRAVLYVSQDFDLQAHIDTVCLPQPEELFDGQRCFATGWGKDEFGAAGNYQVVLKEIDLPVVGHDQCEASLRTTRL